MGLEEYVEGVGYGFGEDVRSGGSGPRSRLVLCSKEMEPG